MSFIDSILFSIHLGLILIYGCTAIEYLALIYIEIGFHLDHHYLTFIDSITEQYDAVLETNKYKPNHLCCSCASNIQCHSAN